MEIADHQKSQRKFICKLCEYNCSKKSDYSKHLLTRKHKNGNNMEIIKMDKTYMCKNCNKNYKTNSGLWKHQNKCIQNYYNTTITTPPSKNKLKI